MFLCFFLVNTFPVCVEAVVTVNVNNKSKIANYDIVLKDIATLKGDDNKLIDKLKGIYICKAPLPGKTKIIKKQHINFRLKQNNIEPDEISLYIPAHVEVKRSFIIISKEKIEKIVRDYLAGNLIKSNRRVRIKNISVRQNLTLPEGNISYRVVPLKEMKLSGIMNIPVIFKVDGRKQKEVLSRVDIEWLSEVVIAKRPLGRNHIISIEDIDSVEKDITKLPLNVITASEDVLGKRTKRKIDSRTVLRTDLVELPPVVRRGDVVTIIAESGCLKISARGKIKKKGHVGEILKVENLDSRKEIYARVIDSCTVAVDF